MFRLPSPTMPTASVRRLWCARSHRGRARENTLPARSAGSVFSQTNLSAACGG